MGFDEKILCLLTEDFYYITEFFCKLQSEQLSILQIKRLKTTDSLPKKLDSIGKISSCWGGKILCFVL